MTDYPNPNDELDDAALRTKLILETSKMPWHELQRYFAGGTMVSVSDKLDLVDVALQFTRDNKQAVALWMEHQLVAKATDQQAHDWLDGNATLWAVVVRPWVLVQPAKPGDAPVQLH